MNKDSIGWRNRDTAVENNLSAAYLNRRVCMESPFTSLTGVSIQIPFSFPRVSSKPFLEYAF